jgi:cell wall-associated NlpC family hydrolase
VSHALHTRSLVLALALLAGVPATARAATGGAAPGGAPAGTSTPAASAQHSGGAAPVAAHARRRRHVRRRAPRAPVGATATPPAAATLLADGTAAAPAGAPAAVVATIAAANRIASLPYRWGGGHASWEDSGYDCSGSVGYALHGGGLLDASATSGDLTRYGAPGPGRWITLYANRDHVFMIVAGLRFDTSGAQPSRWQATGRSAAGYVVRHPTGL